MEKKNKKIKKRMVLLGMILIRELGRQEGSKARKIRYVVVKLVTFSQGGAKTEGNALLGFPLSVQLGGGKEGLAFPLKVK